MKHIILSLSFFSVLGGAFSQYNLQNFHIEHVTSYCSDTKIVKATMQAMYQDEITPTITINWGDGSSSTIDTLSIHVGSNTPVYFSHSYANPGSYAVNATFESTVTPNVYNSNGTMIAASVYTSCNTGSISSPVNWGPFIAIPGTFDLLGNDNSLIRFSGYIANIDANNVPYTLSLNEDWMTQNNYLQTSPDLTIIGFGTNGYPIFAESYTMIDALMDYGSATLDLSAHSGYSYCFSPVESGLIKFSLLDLANSHNDSLLVTVELPDFMTPVTTDLTHASVNGNILTFEITGYNDYAWYLIPVNIPGTTEGGLQYTVRVSVSDLHANETVVGNNSIEISGMVYNSFDPNEKLVNRAENLDPGTAEELQYTVNFQNEGNFPAMKVVVRDTLSENLDLETFKVIDSKHPVVTSLNPNTREVTFTFNSINLLPSSENEEGSKGQVIYSVREKENLPVNSEIANTAYIYFDFNPAVITNTTYNTNTLLSVNELNKASFSIHPNPAASSVKVSTGTKGNTLRMLDLTGKEVTQIRFDNTTAVDISGISNGIYSLVLENKTGIYTEKLVIRH